MKNDFSQPSRSAASNPQVASRFSLAGTLVLTALATVSLGVSASLHTTVMPGDLAWSYVADPMPGDAHDHDHEHVPAEQAERHDQHQHTQPQAAVDATPWLGMSLTVEAQEGVSRVVVTGVYPDSPAAAAGMMPGDVLVNMDGQLLFHTDQVAGLMQRFENGDEVGFEVERGGQGRSVHLTVAARPAALPGMPEMPEFESNWRNLMDQAGGLDLQWRLNEDVRRGLMQQLEQLSQMRMPELDLRNAPFEVPEDMEADLQQQLQGLQENLQLQMNEMRQHLQSDDLEGLLHGLQEEMQRLRQQGPPDLAPLQERLSELMNERMGEVLPENFNGELRREWGQRFGEGQGGVSTVSMSDGEHTLVVTVDQNGRTLRATTRNGDMVFEGPIDTPEQIQALPAEIREKVQRMRMPGAQARPNPEHPQSTRRNVA